MKFHCRTIALLLVLVMALTACSGNAAKPTEPSGQPASTAESKPAATTQAKATNAPAATKTPVPAATAKPATAGTSRSNPLPLGSEFKGKNWSITVTSVTRGADANKAIADANQFNKAPRQGYEYLIANVALKNISDKTDAQQADFAVDLEVTGDRNIAYSRPLMAVPPKPLKGELFKDGTAEGQIVFEVPSDEKNLMFIVDELMSLDAKAKRFVAIDKDAKVVPDAALKGIKATADGKQRDNPAKIGATLIAAGWEFSALEAVRGDKAAEMAKQANQFNKPAPDGQEYVAVRLKARYLGSSDPDKSEMINSGYLKITGEKNVAYDRPSVVAPAPILDATLFAGGQTEGWIVLSVGKDEKGLKLIFQPLFSFSNDDIRYIALE